MFIEFLCVLTVLCST